MIRHVVAWRLAAPDAEDRRRDADEIRRRLEALPAVIPGIERLEVGVDVGETDGNADVVLVADYASRDALAAYQVHPAHLKVAAFIRSVVAGRLCVDYEL